MSAARDRAEVFNGADGKFYFRILAGNGEEIVPSEGYEDKRDALALLATRFPHVPIVDLTEPQ